MKDAMHEIRPLAAYIRGNLRLLLRSGQHVLRIDEETAHKLRVAFDRGEPADSVLQGSFLQIDTNALDAMEWVADSRQPSKESRSDRELRRLGGALFRDGWLRALYDLAPADAAYSVAGLVAWKAAAVLLVIDEPEARDEEERRELLVSLSRLWNNVANPEEMSPQDFADRLDDDLLHDIAGIRPGTEQREPSTTTETSTGKSADGSASGDATAPDSTPDADAVSGDGGRPDDLDANPSSAPQEEEP